MKYQVILGYLGNGGSAVVETDCKGYDLYDVLKQAFYCGAGQQMEIGEMEALWEEDKAAGFRTALECENIFEYADLLEYTYFDLGRFMCLDFIDIRPVPPNTEVGLVEGRKPKLNRYRGGHR